MAVSRLRPQEVEQIVGMLTAWKGKLTWELLLRRVEAMLKRPFSRQGLDKNTSIAIAFKQAKERHRRAGKTADGGDLHPDLAAAQRRSEVLMAELKVLQAEKQNFLEKFAVWGYNARSRGLSEEDLNRPLPRIERGKSEKSS